MRTVLKPSVVQTACTQGKPAQRWTKLSPRGTALQERNSVTEREIADEIARYRSAKKTQRK